MGKLWPEDVPNVACDALERGLDSPALRYLAGLQRPTSRDIGNAFDEACSQLAIAPATDEAVEQKWIWNATQIARHISAQIVVGNGFASLDDSDWNRNRGVYHASAKLLVKCNSATSVREFEKNRQGAKVSIAVGQLVPAFDRVKGAIQSRGGGNSEAVDGRQGQCWQSGVCSSR